MFYDKPLSRTKTYTKQKVPPESEQLNSFKDYFSDKLLSGFSSKNNTNNSRNLSERQLFSGVFDNFIKNFF